MTDGYNVVFNPYRGSLYGRFPSGPVFVSVFLALADRAGHLDYSIEALSGMTGWPIHQLKEAIDDLMQPDPQSRTRELDGRRIVPIEAGRPWGWRVVNIEIYRERARLMAKAARERESGSNAIRMRDRRRPPETADDRLSNSDSKSEVRTPQPPQGGSGHVFGLNIEAWTAWEKYRREMRKAIKGASIEAAQKKLASFGQQQAAVVKQSIEQGWTGLFPIRKDAQPPSKRSPYAGAI